MRTINFCKGLAVGVALAVGISLVLAETKGPVTDDIGVVKVRKGAPIFIGGYWTLSGPDVSLGVDQKRGVELASVSYTHLTLPTILLV